MLLNKFATSLIAQVPLPPLHPLPSILNPLPQDGGEDHADILPEGVVVEVVAVDAHFVREYDVVVVPEGDPFGRALVPLRQRQPHIFRNHFLFVAVFERRRARDAGTAGKSMNMPACARLPGT